MTLKEIKNILEEMELPVAYLTYPIDQAPALPYIVYYLPDSNYEYADGVVYCKIMSLNVELYSDDKDIEMESKLEKILDKYGFAYTKSEAYLKSEEMYEVLYEMEVDIEYEN